MNSKRVYYTCPSGQVEVQVKTSGLRRYPRHDYPCAVVVLRPRPGTRVTALPGGALEFMPAWDELRALIAGIDPKVAARLPKNLRNKPFARKTRFDRFNAARHGRRQR
ncbi:MAG TPA: hypothetical protein VIM57_06230 [Luteolibacter sp.]